MLAGIPVRSENQLAHRGRTKAPTLSCTDFKTVKYDVSFPEQPYGTIEEARLRVAKFVPWYNEKHRHSALKFVTPSQRHRGEDIEILAKRKLVYEAAKALRPERWAGSCRNWERPEIVTLKKCQECQLEKSILDKGSLVKTTEATTLLTSTGAHRDKPIWRPRGLDKKKLLLAEDLQRRTARSYGT